MVDDLYVKEEKSLLLMMDQRWKLWILFFLNEVGGDLAVFFSKEKRVVYSMTSTAVLLWTAWMLWGGMPLE